MQNFDFDPAIFDPQPQQTQHQSRRRGPTPKSTDLVRKHRIAVYFSDSEEKVINGFAELSKVTPAKYLRDAALKTPPTVIAELNQQVWRDLGLAMSNLNQIAKSINSNNPVSLDHIGNAVAAFRAALLAGQK